MANWWAGWVGPLRFPRGWSAAWLAAFRALDDRLAPWPRWAGLALALGSVPVLIDYALGWRVNHAVTALLALPLLLAAVARDRVYPSFVCLLLVYLVHAATVITLAAHSPQRLAVCLPDGEQYWRETVHWLRTGEVGVYDVGHWVPYHLSLAAVVPLFCYLTLGLMPLYQGLHQIDLMNFYVGQYLAHAERPGAMAVLAWHPWSVCRGLGFLFLVYELTSLSLARLTGQPLSPLSRRLWRVGLGLGFLLLDGAVKWTFTEPVRQILSAGLRS